MFEQWVGTQLSLNGEYVLASYVEPENRAVQSVIDSRPCYREPSGCHTIPFYTSHVYSSLTALEVEDRNKHREPTDW